MSFLKREFCKSTIRLGEEHNTFNDDKKIITVFCSHCKNQLNIEYSVIRGLAGKLLSRSRRKK